MLHLAIIINLDSDTVLRVLSALLSFGIMLDDLTRDGDTLLHLEALRGTSSRMDVFAFLISSGLDVNNIGSSGRNVMSLVLFQWADNAGGIVKVLPKSPTKSDAILQAPIEILASLEASGGFGIIGTCAIAEAKQFFIYCSR